MIHRFKLHQGKTVISSMTVGHLYLIVILHVIRMFFFLSFFFFYHSYVTRMSFLFNCMSLLCHPNIIFVSLVCQSYILVCNSMPFACHSWIFQDPMSLVVWQLVRQLLYTSLLLNHALFNLWWNENLLNHQEVSKIYEHNCVKNLLFLLMSLSTFLIVKSSRILAGTYYTFLKKPLRPSLDCF